MEIIIDNKKVLEAHIERRIEEKEKEKTEINVFHYFYPRPPVWKNNIDDYPYYAHNPAGYLRFALDTRDYEPAAYYRDYIRYYERRDDYQIIYQLLIYRNETLLRTYFEFFNPKNLDINMYLEKLR